MSDETPVSTPARERNGHYAEQSFAAVYDALAREINRIDGLRAADQISLQAALTAAKTAVDAALAAAEKAVAAALIAAKEAVNKAEVAQQRTNEGQNEFRGQLKDQAATLLPRTEYFLAHNALEDKIDVLEKDLGALRSRIDVGPPSLGALQRESDQRSGHDAGASATWTQIALAAGIAGAVVGIIIQLWPK